MNKIIACLLVGTMGVSTLFSTLASPDEKASDQGNTLPVLAWSQGEKHFTTSFYPFAKQSNQNLVFSPLSLQLGLAMAAELAYGKTQEEILQIGVLPADENSRRQGAEAFMSRINAVAAGKAESVKFFLANSAWISTEIAVPPSLDGILLPYYHAEIHQANFHHDPAGMCTIINAWVADKTSNQIKKLLPKNSLNPQTALVLVNTLYLHAAWERPFDPKMTYEAPFYGPENSLNTVSFMRQVGRFGMLDEMTYQVIELCFKRSNDSHYSLSLFVVLPKEGYSLEDVEAKMTTRRLDHWLSDTQTRQLDLSLPKFKLSAALNAKEILKEMGMERPFSPYEAEFDLGDLNRCVAITDIVHQAVFEVDEQGGTGSAATGVVIGPTCWQERKEVVINRPFLVFVADKINGLILFAGHVTKP